MTSAYCCRARCRVPSISLLLWLALLIFRTTYAQEINLRIQHITSDQGLSQNTVDCILQDSRGFMWFGTWNGLNRYDGYNFLVYKSDNSANSLSNNFIYSICEDKSGDLWIGTKNGLNRFHHAQNKFTRYVHKPGNPNSLSGNTITSVLCDHRGSIWVGTPQGLNRLVPHKTEPGGETTEQVKVLGTENINNYSINALFEDRGNNIWIGTNLGLLKYNPTLNTTLRFTNQASNINSLSNNNVSAVFEDHLGYIWIGTQYGLNRLTPSTGNIERYLNNPDVAGSISHSVINDIKDDNLGNLLVATLGGLNKYIRNQNNFYRYPVNDNNDYCLNNEFINAIYVDKRGNVWIGTDKGGANKFSTNQKPFGCMFHGPPNSNCLSSNTVNSILDEPATLWIGTAGGGLNRYNKATGQFSHYVFNTHDRAGINSDFVTSLCRDKSNQLWVGTWGGGLNKMVSPNGKGVFEKYITTGNPNSICNPYISSICEDKRGFLVIGTLGGLDLCYPTTGIFKHIAAEPQWKNRITEVGCILPDRKGNYWIGTRIGLFRIPATQIDGPLKDSDIRRFVNDPHDPHSLPGNYIISLCEDNAGNIWVGTYGNGISRIAAGPGGKTQFVSYTEKDGLANNVAYAILEDNQQNLWISTDNGLSRFSPRNNAFKNFFVTDGLQSNQFYWSAAFKNKDGHMYFGGIKGLNFFHPDSIRDNTYVPAVVITDFKIFNTSVGIGTWNHKKTILEKAINETSEIGLSYQENVFSFEFSALDYFLPEKTSYQYKMEGVDQNWVTVPASKRFATYTNLKGGDYTFWVKANNSDGVWSNVPTKLSIHISPPFWATTWFKLIDLLAIFIFIFAYFRFRTKRLQTQKKVLETMVKERTAKVEEQKEELKVQAQRLIESNNQLGQRQSLIEGQKAQLEQQNIEISEQRDKLIELNKRVQLVNQLKLRFFTNISHEFRTPLTLILGPIDKLLASWRGDGETKDTLLLINRNAQRLLHLINQLMEFRKIETGKMTLKASRGDMAKMLDNIFQSFLHLAGQRKIEYTFIHGSIDGEQWFDHEKTENIVFNLLSNAFKFTPENGRITLSLSAVNRNEPDTSGKWPATATSFLEIQVKDTGTGISQEHINHIFKRFYQVNSAESLKVKGSGIGLSLTKELVKAHRGFISVESQEGKGSVFTVLIPYRQSSFEEKELVSEPPAIKENIQEQVSKLTEELMSEKPPAAETVLPKADLPGLPLVLVAEDNFDLRSFISVSLSGEFRVVHAENGKDAYEIAKSNNIDVIVSDIMMPEMDGLEFCSRLKNNLLTSHIPVILLTARSSVENWIEGLETGADDYMPKPFDVNLLIVRIKNLIESRRKLQKHFSSELVPDLSKIAVSGADMEFMQKAMDTVEKNFSDPDFGVDAFVKRMNISRSLLHKKLSALTGQSAGDFITSFRLKNAARLLQQAGRNVSEIAYDVGFNDPKYFSRIFRKYYGTAPSDYGQ